MNMLRDASIPLFSRHSDRTGSQYHAITIIFSWHSHKTVVDQNHVSAPRFGDYEHCDSSYSNEFGNRFWHMQPLYSLYGRDSTSPARTEVEYQFLMRILLVCGHVSFIMAERSKRIDRWGSSGGLQL